MFGFGKERKIEKELKELKKEVSEIQENLKKLQELLSVVEDSIEEFKAYQENKAFMKESDEPWADFMASLPDSDGRVKITFDWNKAMIEALRRQGFNGNKEEDIISAFFSTLMADRGDITSNDFVD